VTFGAYSSVCTVVIPNISTGIVLFYIVLITGYVVLRNECHMVLVVLLNKEAGVTLSHSPI